MNERYCMAYFVYFNDDYCENGGVGLKEVTSPADVETFITDRMAQDPKRKIDMYTVIEGNKRSIRPIEVVTKVQLT